MAAERSGSAGSGVSRRKLLTSAGVAAGGIAAVGVGVPGARGEAPEGQSGAVISEGSSTVVGGVVVRVIDRRSLEIMPAPPAPGATQPETIRSGSKLVVEMTDGAELLRDGPVVLAAFVPGDEVAAAGGFSASGRFVASNLESVYHVVEADVTARNGSKLDTSGDDLVLRPDSRTADGHWGSKHVRPEPIADLGPGDHVVAQGRHDPKRHDELLVSRIGVVSN